MAITKNAPAIQNRTRPAAAAPWSVNATTADCQGNEILQAAPGTGFSLYVEWLVINCITATTVVINDDASALFGPYSFDAAGASVIYLDYRDSPVKLTANKALKAAAAAGGQVTITGAGFTAP